MKKDLLYPFNLLREINFEQRNITDDQYNGIEEAILQTKPNISYILFMRFKNYKTYEEISKDLGVTRERVRQLKNVGLQYIRDNLMGYIRYGKITYENQLIKAKEKEYENIASISNLPIEKLTLPTRIYNILKNQKIKTVGDLLKLIDLQWENIQLGRKSKIEIFNSLSSLGLLLDRRFVVYSVRSEEKYYKGT